MVVVPYEMIQNLADSKSLQMNEVLNDDLIRSGMNTNINKQESKARLKRSEDNQELTVPVRKTDGTQTDSTIEYETPMEIESADDLTLIPVTPIKPAKTQIKYTPITSKGTPYKEVKDQLKKLKAFSRSGLIKDWFGVTIKDSNIDSVLKFAYDPDETVVPIGAQEIAKFFKVLQIKATNPLFLKYIKQQKGLSPSALSLRSTPVKRGQTGKGKWIY